MGRAIVRNPQVFLMDEPLSNLDAKLRVQTRTQIASLQRRLGITTVYVTHDQVEAMTMGDRVAVLKDGLLQQVDTPRRMYDHPDNVFVAGFIGSPAMNLIDTAVTDGGVQFGSGTYKVAREHLAAAGKTVTVGVRPEDLDLTTEGNGLAVTVDVVEELGADAYIYGNTQQARTHVLDAEESAEDKPFIARVDGRKPPEKGQTIYLAPKEGHIHMFNASTGERIGD
jgi:multiple sugar transport system ATP-binding protein